MWTVSNDSLIKEFTFPDFKTALLFVNKVGDISEEVNHHPGINLSWGKVVITLTTHKSNSITDKDRDLANKIDNIYS